MTRFFDLGFAIDETAKRPEDELVIMVEIRTTMLPGDRMVIRFPKENPADPDHAVKMAAVRAAVERSPVEYGRAIPLAEPTGEVRRVVKSILADLANDVSYWLNEARDRPNHRTRNGVTREQEYGIRANELGNTIAFIRLRYLKRRRYLRAH